MEQTIEFWLNDQRVVAWAPPGLLLLDYLRRRRNLTGTKEGCKEGDCGACSVIVGQLHQGQVRYEVMTSCLVPLGEMHGRHVVTIEGLNLECGLNPVQEAMCQRGASQCGFCTPGFIVSMCSYVLTAPEEPSLDGFKRAFSGNLCRCTGYGAINRASEDLVKDFGPQGRWQHLWSSPDRPGALAKAGLLPPWFAQMAERLQDLHNHPHVPHDETLVDDSHHFIIAGGTDLYVQRGEDVPHSKVAILNRFPQMRGVRQEGQELHIGALTSFEAFGQAPEVQALIPRIQDYLFLIASLPLRHRATLAGNIVNASPIGDMTAILLALGTRLVLKRGLDLREVALKDFFLGYKILDKAPDEVVTELLIPLPPAGTRVHFEKVSKRQCLDIASVNSAICLAHAPDGTIAQVAISMGGVAPTPLLLRETASFLAGKTPNLATLDQALDILQGEIAPISDVRGSADYKRLLAQQLLVAHFKELFPAMEGLDALLTSEVPA